MRRPFFGCGCNRAIEFTFAEFDQAFNLSDLAFDAPATAFMAFACEFRFLRRQLTTQGGEN